MTLIRAPLCIVNVCCGMLVIILCTECLFPVQQSLSPIPECTEVSEAGCDVMAPVVHHSRQLCLYTHAKSAENGYAIVYMVDLRPSYYRFVIDLK